MKNLCLSVILFFGVNSIAAPIGNLGPEIPQSIVVSATAASYTVGGVTFTDAGDIVTLSDHRLVNGTLVSFGSIVTTTGISINTNYYVKNATTNTFQLALTPSGAALPLTTNGSGALSTNYYAIVHAVVSNGGTFSINGVVFLTSMTWSTIASNTSPHTITGGGSGPPIPGFSTATNNANSQLPASGSTGVYLNNTVAWTSSPTFTNSSAMTSIEHTFKVPSGTVLVGSGSASYAIEIYRK
jgi:hypothetical protein